MQSTERSTRSSRRNVTEPAPSREPQNAPPDTGQYICIECSETFNNKLELNSHRQSHVTKKQFTCSHCGRGFHHQFFLQMHERSHEDGIPRTPLTKQSTGRVISTRSSKPLPETDIIHVTAAPSKSVYHLNSKVEFKREWKVGQEVTPTECVTRRTQGTYSPPCQRTDSSDRKSQFELRISKLSDSTVRLIDPYGNTLEILAEVFNTYTIGEADEEDGSVSPSSDSRSSEIPAAPPSTTLYPDKPDQMAALSPPQAEISETDDPINEDAMEEDLPLCPIESVYSASVSPKTMPDLCDEDISSAHTTHELTGNEGIVSQPDAKEPKISIEKESLPRNDEGATMTYNAQMIPEAPIVGDVNVCNKELSEVTARPGDPSLQVGAQDDPVSVPLEYSELLQRSLLQKEGKSPEPSGRINYQEKDGNGYDLQPVLKDPSITDSLDLNKDRDQLVISGAQDAQEPKSDLDFIIEPKTGLEVSGEVSLTAPDEMQDVTMLEGDDGAMLQTPVTEHVSESDERQKESANVFSSTDHSSLGPDPVLQANLAAATGVFNIPIDNEEVNPKDGNDTASKHELEPGLGEEEISKLSQGVHDEASSPFPSVDVPSESKSLCTAGAESSVDTPNQSALGPSGHAESSVERDIEENVLTSLEKQVSQPDMSDTLSQIASGTMPQDVPPEQGLETKEGDGQGEHETDLPAPDPPQTNDSTLEPSPDNDPESPEGSHLEQGVNLKVNETESDISSFAVRQSTKKEETESEASGVTPAETDSLTSTENTIDNASSEDIQAPVQVIQCGDTEKMSVEESGEEIPFSLLEPQAVSAADGLLPLCDEDLSLGTCAESISFSVPTLVSITSACVKAQERVLIQETEPTKQDPAASLMSDKTIPSTRPIESSDLKDDILLQKLEGKDLGPSLCLLEPTLELSPDLEDLSEKCLLSSDEMKDLTESDIEKNLPHDDPQKQYIQMSNANLTENDLAEDFVGSGSILLDAPSVEEATKEDDLTAVSVADEGTTHELADMLSPEVQESEYTEGQDDKQVGFGGLCLKCGRRVRRGRKELIWFPVCYKCRLKAKREERHSGEGTSSDFSSFRIKQETDPVQDDSFYKTAKPGQGIHSIKQESGALHRKMYKCPKCEEAFKFPALLAGHMKCHTSPQCLTCGCPLILKYKTKRIPKRCHKCLQKLRHQRKEERALSGADHKDSLESDSGSVSADDTDLQSLSSDDEENEPSLTSTKINDPKPGSVRRGTEPFHSIFMRERKKINPAVHALYCTCDVVLKSGGRQPKICKSCQKPVRDRLATGSHVHRQTIEGKQPKKGKMQSPIEADRQNLLLGDSSLSHENESPDEFCKEEDEALTELDMSDQSVAPDGEKPRLCPECGKVFKCNRSLHLHLLSHSATQCESCGCRLQKKKRAGRWSKKCRVCRLLTKDKGLPDGAIEDVVSREKNMASLRLKMKKSKVVRTKKVQSTAKLKKELNWMNMILAVKGLTQKPRKKKVSIKSPSEVRTSDGSEPAESDTTSKCDPGSSGLQVSHKKILSGVSKVSKKCVYREKNIIKVEEQQLPPYTDDPLSTAVSVKEEEENQCLECNEVFPNIDLLVSHQQGHIEGQPFTCAQCPQSFSTEQYLSIHVNVHAEGPPFRCPECNKTFTRRNHLGVHRRVHTGSRPYACPDCPCRFRQRGSLIIHRYTHRNLQLMMLKPYQCSVCNKSFKQKERLVIHERLHTGECPFSCKDCDKVFPSKSRLYVHRKIHKIPEALSGVEPNASCKEELEGPPFQCKDCDKVCSTKASFVLHRKVHRSSAVFCQSSSHEENPEGIIPLTTSEDLGIKTEQEGHPLSCKDCNKVFSTKASFVLHRKVHRLSQRSDVGSPAFMCKDCGKVCSTKASLVLHRKVHKSPLISDLKATIGDPPYICKLCKKVCSTKASFVLHCKVHKVLSSNEKILKLKEQKSFLCKKCGFVCSTKASFVLHRKVHRSSPNLVQKDGTGQHPFTCKDCNKVCSTKASFVLHCKVHRVVLGSDQSSTPPADVEEKPYHCKDCGKIYSTKGRLLSHMKLHGQDTSADCEQLLKIDTEEKPFACPICHMRFTRLKILVRHKLIHGEDVLRCGHCGKRFLFQKSLMNHVLVCLKRSKAKTLLGKEKVPKKRKMKDGSTNEESAPKKRKNEKKVVTAMQKIKNKKLNKVKKMAASKEKGKAKSSNEKKIKKPKGETEQEPEAEGEKQNDGKPERALETGSKEKETAKDKKPKDVGKIKKVLKKVPQKQKRQKVNSESLKKWRMIAAATVKKRKLQAVISGGKKKATVKKKGLSKAKTGGKNSKE